MAFNGEKFAYSGILSAGEPPLHPAPKYRRHECSVHLNCAGIALQSKNCEAEGMGNASVVPIHARDSKIASIVELHIMRQSTGFATLLALGKTKAHGSREFARSASGEIS